MPVYTRIAQALEALVDRVEVVEEEDPPSNEHPCASLEAIKAATERAFVALSPPTDENFNLATQLVRGHSKVEVPGKRNKHGDAVPNAIILRDPKSLADFVNCPCKHEVSLVRQIRQGR